MHPSSSVKTQNFVPKLSVALPSALFFAGKSSANSQPQNILFEEQQKKVWLLDFGLASRLAFESTVALIPEALEGTLAYISPEQTGRTSRTLDARTDLYSLGVTLFEMISGRHPFLETDPLALVHAHLAKLPPALDALMPEVPSSVARIVERLLAKDPDKRYQTARGLMHDLDKCLEQWQREGKISPFPVAQRDFSPKLRLPEQLIGREAEVEVLRFAFERAANGAVELLLVGGPSGIGKTALIRSVYREMARRGRGLLLSGKHDQLARSVPYAALVQAFGGLMQNIAASPRATVDAWKECIETAMGGNARVIADLIPELNWVMGNLPPVPELPSDQAYNRLKLAWIYFVQAVLSKSEPLVLFLDDLQWIDPASLELLKVLLTDAERRSILLIAVYRDNEIDATHPLWNLADAVVKNGDRVSKQTLRPLEIFEIAQWLSVALCALPEHVAPLATVLWNKTRGNPFFLGQLLLEMYRSKSLLRNLDSGVWIWNSAQIETLAVTDNVVDLMQSKLRDLPEATCSLLGLAACAGHVFTLDELAVLSASAPQAVAQALWPALREGILITADLQAQYVQALVEENQPLGQLQSRYQFLHDRVQQACHQLIAPSEQKRAHLDIGRRFLGRYKAQGGTAQELLELVRHLNLGVDCMDSPQEVRDLVQLNLDAARKAKAAGVYRLMAELALQGSNLLGPGQWENDFELAAQLAIERVEATYMLRQADEVEALVLSLLDRNLPLITIWTLQEIRMRAHLISGKMQKASALGKTIFGQAGRKIPDTVEVLMAESVSMLKAIDAWRERLGEEGLSAIPLDSDPLRTTQDAATFTWIYCLMASGEFPLITWGLPNAISSVIEKGTQTRHSALLLATATNLWGPIFDQPREAAWLAIAATWLRKNLNSPAADYVDVIVGSVLLYRHHARESLPIFERVIADGLEQGNFSALSGGCFCAIRDSLIWPGAPLSLTRREIEKKMLLVRRAGDSIGQNTIELSASYVECLLNRAPLSCRPDGGILPFGSKELLARGDGLNGSLADVLELPLFLMICQPAQAYQHAQWAMQHQFMLRTVALGSDILLCLALAAAALMDTTTAPEERAQRQQELEQSIVRFRYLAEGCAENFLHKLYLLEAEQARLAGKDDVAMAKYDAAIDYAHKQDFRQIVALAAQLCGQYHQKAGRRRMAALYLRESRSAYERWEAHAIVRFMDEHYADYLQEPAEAAISAIPALAPTRNSTSRPGNAATATIRSSRTTHSGGALLDAETVIRATQALASELHPERIVAQLMHLVVENAGAQRGALFLTQGDALFMAARLITSTARIETNLHIPLFECTDVPQIIIDAVARTRQPLFLSDAPADSRFGQEPLLRASNSHSVLVIPLLHQARLVGALYLEHEERNAFSAQSMNLLGVLSAQTAIALENANLYDALRKSNVELESQVAARTTELQDTLLDLWSEMDLATKIQTVLLPKDGVYGGHEFAATMRPAAKVGGDYYDVFEHAGATWVLIGDVSGHGVSAGLIMMMVQSAIRTLVGAKENVIPSPAEVLTRVNAGIASNLQKIGKGQYMTLVALCVEGSKVRFAGLHLDLLVYRAALQTVEHIKTEGIYIGWVEDASGLYFDTTLTLDADDILLLYTDGLTEARKGSVLLGLEDVQRILLEKGQAQATPRQIIDATFGLLEGTQCSDDISVVTLKVGESPSNVAAAISQNQV